MNQQITAIVPTWNRRALLERLLDNLRGTDVIVVDNGSTDGSAESARQRGARVIVLASNAGFATAVNRGVAAAQAPWLAIVNNDVELETGYLENLRIAAEAHSAAFAVGKLFRAGSSTQIDGTYDLVSRAACAWRAGHNTHGPLDRLRRIQFVPFTAVLIRRSVIDELGGLDERFGSYLEDVDFCLRSTLAGHYGVYVPEAKGWHEGSATLGPWDTRMVELISRNQVWLVAKHYPHGWFWSVGWPVLVGQLLWGVLAMRHGATWAWIVGKWKGLRDAGRFRSTFASATVIEVLSQSEQELCELQQELGFDWYWKTYFRLVGTSA